MAYSAQGNRSSSQTELLPTAPEFLCSVWLLAESATPRSRTDTHDAHKKKIVADHSRYSSYGHC